MLGKLIKQTWLIWKFLCMDYSSFVSVKSRHDCHEGMKDGNHSERRSSDSFFPPERRQGAQHSYLDSFQSCLAVTSLGWFTVCSQFYPYICFSSTIWDVPRKQLFWSRRVMANFGDAAFSGWRERWGSMSCVVFSMMLE